MHVGDDTKKADQGVLRAARRMQRTSPGGVEEEGMRGDGKHCRHGMLVGGLRRRAEHLERVPNGQSGSQRRGLLLKGRAVKGTHVQEDDVHHQRMVCDPWDAQHTRRFCFFAERHGSWRFDERRPKAVVRCLYFPVSVLGTATFFSLFVSLGCAYPVCV